MRKELACTHERIRHCRKNWIDQITHRLVNDSQVTSYVIEDLNLRGMVKNHHLARAVSDVGIGNFFRTLQYKSKAVGKNLIVAGRWYPSSKRCPECGTKKESLTLKEREWCCAKCGHEHDRDRWKRKRFLFEEFPRGETRRCGFLGERLEPWGLKWVARSSCLLGRCSSPGKNLHCLEREFEHKEL